MYEISITIGESSPDREQAIKDACESEWDFDNWYGENTNGEDVGFGSTAEGSLGCGLLEEQFAKLLAEKVWEANGGKCCVRVGFACLDYVPYDYYTFDEEADFERVT